MACWLLPQEGAAGVSLWWTKKPSAHISYRSMVDWGQVYTGFIRWISQTTEASKREEDSAESYLCYNEGL